MSNGAPTSTEDLDRNQTRSVSSPSLPSAYTTTTRTLASRKGELYLPLNTETTSQDGSTSTRSLNESRAEDSRLEADDLHPPAARMVVMTASGRPGDQALTRESLPRDRDRDRDKKNPVGTREESPAPPPLYKDVVRRSESRTGGGTH